MKNLFNKTLSIILAIALAITMMPGAVFAEGDTEKWYDLDGNEIELSSITAGTCCYNSDGNLCYMFENESTPTVCPIVYWEVNEDFDDIEIKQFLGASAQGRKQSLDCAFRLYAYNPWNTEDDEGNEQRSDFELMNLILGSNQVYGNLEKNAVVSVIDNFSGITDAEKTRAKEIIDAMWPFAKWYVDLK